MGFEGLDIPRILWKVGSTSLGDLARSSPCRIFGVFPPTVDRKKKLKFYSQVSSSAHESFLEKPPRTDRAVPHGGVGVVILRRAPVLLAGWKDVSPTQRGAVVEDMDLRSAEGGQPPRDGGEESRRSSLRDTARFCSFLLRSPGYPRFRYSRLPTVFEVFGDRIRRGNPAPTHGKGAKDSPAARVRCVGLRPDLSAYASRAAPHAFASRESAPGWTLRDSARGGTHTQRVRSRDAPTRLSTNTPHDAYNLDLRELH